MQRRLTHYRRPFFEKLRRKLDERGISLQLAYGEPTSREAMKQDSAEIDWATRLKTTYLADGRFCWQPFGALLSQSDMVVVTHENKMLYNLYAQCIRIDVKLALWGHGANMQGSTSSWRERLKRRTARQADWWFGYTEMSRPLILGSGFPADRITVVDNAIDTTALRRHYEAVLPGQLSAWRARLGLAGTRVGVYIGSMYSEKRIGFLLDAASLIRARVPDFELVIAGAGVESCKVSAFCASNAWAHYVGPVRGEEKAQVLALAHVMLNPGLVGLGILDSLVCGVPLVTTDCGIHSPEIAYLENAHNGLMVRNDMLEYVDAVADLLIDDEYREHLVAGCAESASKYTIDNMVRKFADGVMRCLDASAHRSVV